jgi:hypothetical protein
MEPDTHTPPTTSEIVQSPAAEPEVIAAAVVHEQEIAEIKEEVAKPVDWEHPVPLLDQLTPDLVIPDGEATESVAKQPGTTPEPEAPQDNPLVFKI